MPPPRQEQEEAAPTGQDRQHVEHINPSLWLNRLHHENAEPASHRKESRQGIKPHAERTRSFGVAFSEKQKADDLAYEHDEDTSENQGGNNLHQIKQAGDG